MNIRYFDLNDNTDDKYLVNGNIDSSYMVEIPNDNKPYGLVNGEVVCIENTEEYLNKKLGQAKEVKFSDITKAYENSVLYKVIKIDDNYFNRAWITTYNEVIELQPTDTFFPIRVYTLLENGKYKNISIENINTTLLNTINKGIKSYRYTNLQPKRDQLNALVITADTIEKVNAITVAFGTTINEQDINDVLNKMEI